MLLVYVSTASATLFAHSNSGNTSVQQYKELVLDTEHKEFIKVPTIS